MAILKIEGLSKRFSNTLALNNVSFEVKDGSVTGILGPNGAGKTTLLRIINGILTSDSGKVTVNEEPASIKASRQIGYMPEERGLYEKMTVEDQIMYFGRLKGGDPLRLRTVMTEYLEVFNLLGQQKRKVKELSKGNQQKVQIIATLVHEPSLVILDEPFSGFDPINGAILQDVISQLKERGATVMLSSHNMAAIEEMCSDIVLIDHGNILLKGSLEEIKESHRDGDLILTTKTPISTHLMLDSGIVESIAGCQPMNWRKGNAYRIRLKEGYRNNDVLDAVALQAEVIHFEEVLPSLNDIFMKYTLLAKEEEQNK